jgi:hypothetical protein
MTHYPRRAEVQMADFLAALQAHLETLGPGNVIALVGVTVGVITAIRGLIEYDRAQRWKRGEFLASEMKAFHADPAIRKALFILDWSDRKVELFPDRPDPESRYVLVDDALLESALNPSSKLYRDEEVAIRDLFITLFDALERLEDFIASGLITTRQLKPFLYYWIETIADYERAGERSERLTAIANFIAAYEYTGVNRLIQRFGFGDRTRDQGRVAPATGMRKHLRRLKRLATDR